MDTINKLARAFNRFPGIGPRQAKRFVYFLLKEGGNTTKELQRLLEELPNEVSQCRECFRYHTDHSCRYCTDEQRTRDVLLVVATDADLDSIERSHTFNGMYFVLGGTISLTEREPEKFVRIRELLERTKTVTPSEIIMAFAANSEGDNTIDYLRSLLADSGMKLSTLGRGLSTGSELEYADTDTIRNALEGRK